MTIANLILFLVTLNEHWRFVKDRPIIQEAEDLLTDFILAKILYLRVVGNPIETAI